MLVVYHLIAFLGFTKRIGDILTQAKAIVAAVANNTALFPAPTPPLAALTAAIVALDESQTASKSRTIGAAATRDVKLRELKHAFNLLLAYVQWIADASPDQSQAIIEAAQMKVVLVPTQTKSELTAKLAGNPGSIDLFAKAGPAAKKSFYDWQINVDGKTWVSLPSTVKAHTRVDNLTPATMVSARFRRTDAKGPKAWSQVVTILVH